MHFQDSVHIKIAFLYSEMCLSKPDDKIRFIQKQILRFEVMYVRNNGCCSKDEIFYIGMSVENDIKYSFFLLSKRSSIKI